MDVVLDTIRPVVIVSPGISVRLDFKSNSLW